MSRPPEGDWQEAARRCSLSQDELRMAKELGLRPKSLIKNVPSPSQPWKAPVREWVRSQYEKKFGSRAEPAAPPAPRSPAEERRNTSDPWPDHPMIPVLPPLVLDADMLGEESPSLEPPREDEIFEEDVRMLMRQRLLRWAAQAIAGAVSKLPEVEKLAAFGAVSQPLEKEVPRFREYRRNRIAIFHECADLDLAVWLNDLTRLRDLKRAISRALAGLQHTPYGGVPHHQVDVHVFDVPAGEYRGRLCIFGECPKPGKWECSVPGCGAQPFLQQFRDYRFDPALFASLPKVLLFDRSTNFLVAPPVIRAKLRDVRWLSTPREESGHGRDFTEDDAPF